MSDTDSDLGRRRHRGLRWVRLSFRAGEPVVFVDVASDHVDGPQCRRRAHPHGPGRARSCARPRRVLPQDRWQGHLPALHPRRKSPPHGRGGDRGPRAPHLAADGFVVSAQNGLNEHVIAETIGARADDRLLRQFRCRLHGARRGALWWARRRGAGGTRWRPMSERLTALHSLFKSFDADAIVTAEYLGLSSGPS